MLESALAAGFTSAGVDVVLLGPLPTPGVAYLTRAQRASLGVVISASHNAFADNGIKFFSAQGTKLDDAWELDVEAVLAEPPTWSDSAGLGKARRLDDAAGRYIEFCKSTFANDLSLKELRIVVDGAHGAAYHIAPLVFHELGAEVIAIGCEPDGLNINNQVGATHPEALIAAVKAHRADYGIALDGDADRLQLVDAKGRLFNGDEVLFLMVKERLDKHTTGDGLISALQVLQACVRSGKTIAALLSEVVLFPQTLINVRLKPGQDWRASTALAAETQAVEAELGDSGRLLIRASGTEPLIRVMVEARDAQQAKACAERIANTVRI